MRKTAIIVGADGQDGKIAFEYLSEKGYRIIGIDRDAIRTKDVVWTDPVDISKPIPVASLIQEVHPEEIYFLAAFHHSSQDKAIPEGELFEMSYRVHVFSYINFLEAIKEYSPHTKIFYAASSLIFGETETEEQNEKTDCRPKNAYGITKLDGLLISRLYHEKYKVAASVGILFNHESEYRSSKFISMKVVEAAVKIKNGHQTELVVGDLSAAVDWGYARDYVDAMHRILELPETDEYIIATGETHTVRELVQVAFSIVGLDWEKYVREDARLLTRKRGVMRGNATKLRSATGWAPQISFEEMIRRMVMSRLNETI